MAVPIQRFAARWSLTVWIITLGVIVGVICLMGLMLRSATQVGSGQASQQWALVAAGLIMPIVLGIAVFFAPLGYTVYPQALVVNRMGPNVVIPVARIAEVCRIESREIGMALRVAGSGGFFGGFGRFYSRQLGWFRAYTTTNKDLVLITQMDGTRTLISPSPADAFLDVVARARTASA